MLARVLIQGWTKPRVAEISQQRRNRRESTQGPSNPPRPNLARRRILCCRLRISYTSNRGGQLSAVQGFANRARGANQTFEELGLRRLASMSIRRRSVWIAGLSLNRRCWNCGGTVRLIGREFRALATILHRSGT